MARSRSLAALAVASAAALAGASPPAASEHLLLQAAEAQLLARARRRPPLAQRLVLADGQIAQSLRRSRMDPHELASAVGGGIVAILEAVGHFTAVPPRIGEGIGALGRNLLRVVDPLREQFNNTAEFEDFQREWNQFFDDVPELVDGVQEKITNFTENGRPDLLVLAIGDILVTLSDGVMKFVPHQTALEVVKYVDSVGDILNAIGISWSGFESGQEIQAIEDLYYGLRAAVEQMTPEDLRNDATYKLVIGTLDGVVANLSDTVLSFQKHMVEGAVCWKVQGSRHRKRPHICADGYLWNGERFCLPRPAGSTPSSFVSLEAATSRKSEGGAVDSAAGQKREVPDGMVVASCEDGSPFSEVVNHWCYAPCPAGMVALGLQCRTACHGEFPADDGAMMCGHSGEAIAGAIMNMVVQLSSSAVEAGLRIKNLVDHGVDTDALVKTIAAFTDMGKPFAYNNCPIVAPTGSESPYATVSS